MKKCPFCAEEIQDAAIKCRHCGEFLDGAVRPPATDRRRAWYFRTSFIVIAICCVGPFALPLVWWRPQTSVKWKIGMTIGVAVLTWLTILITRKSVDMLREYYELMMGF